MYPVWAASLNLLIGCADSITAYSIDDNNQIMTRMCQSSLCYVYAVLIFVAVSSGSGISIPTTIYLAVIAYWNSMHRLLAPRLASVSWNLNKVVADYMYEEHTRSGSSYDPTSMEGYHYLVDWPLHKSTLEARTSYAIWLTVDDAQVIDIERIWLCNGGSLSQEVRDTCLSLFFIC
jgi:hypothetical protein